MVSYLAWRLVMGRAEQFVSKMLAKHLYLVTLLRLMCSRKLALEVMRVAVDQVVRRLLRVAIESSIQN